MKTETLLLVVGLAAVLVVLLAAAIEYVVSAGSVENRWK